MKPRSAFSALALLVVMTMATGAFAQGTFRVSSGIEPRGRMNGHAEEAGGISLFLLNGTVRTDQPASIVIDYGVPITNAVANEATDANPNPISVAICPANTGDPTYVTATAAETVAVVSGNTITITASTDCDTVNDVINIDNVRLSLVGSGLDSIEASVAATGDVRLLTGGGRFPVISTIGDPLGDDDVEADEATLIRHTGNPDGRDNMFKLVITEPTVDAFTGANINLEFSGIPDGATVTVDAWVTTKELYDEKKVDTATLRVADDDADPVIAAVVSNDQVSVNTPGEMEGAVTAEENEAIVLIGANTFDLTPDVDDPTNDAMGGMLSTTDRDVVIVRGWIDFDDADTKKALLPLSLDIQVTADLGPIGVAKPKGQQTPAVPRFDSDKTAAMTVIESTSDQTKFLVPYAVTDGTSGGYDTGFSIANTTSGTTAQHGVVTFSFPGDATLEDFESRMVGPGENLTVLLSEILGTGAVYTGQVMITTEFNGAEGVAFVSNFMTFTSATPLIKEEKE